MTCRRQEDKSAEFKPASAPSHFTPSNVNVQPENMLHSAPSLFDIDKFFDNAIIEVETVEHIPFAKKASEKSTIESMDSDDDFPIGSNVDSNEDEDGVLQFTEAKTDHNRLTNSCEIRQLPMFDKPNAEPLYISNGNMKTFSQPGLRFDGEQKLDLECLQFSVAQAVKSRQGMTVQSAEEEDGLEKLVHVKESKLVAL